MWQYPLDSTDKNSYTFIYIYICIVWENILYPDGIIIELSTKEESLRNKMSLFFRWFYCLVAQPYSLTTWTTSLIVILCIFFSIFLTLFFCLYFLILWDFGDIYTQISNDNVIFKRKSITNVFLFGENIWSFLLSKIFDLWLTY